MISHISNSRVTGRDFLLMIRIFIYISTFCHTQLPHSTHPKKKKKKIQQSSRTGTYSIQTGDKRSFFSTVLWKGSNRFSVLLISLLSELLEPRHCGGNHKGKP